MSPFLLAPLCLAGAAMMLFGVGEWGRWGYLLVFLSIPVSLVLLFIMPNFLVRVAGTAGEALGFIIPASAVAGTCAVVRKYYARRKSQGAES